MSFNDIKQEPNIIIESFYLIVVFKSIVINLISSLRNPKRHLGLGGLKYWRFGRNTLSETKSKIYTPKRDD